MRYFLNVVYFTLLVIAAPVILWRSLRLGKYREGWREKLWGSAPNLSPCQHRIWFHAVSVGEVNLLPGVISKLRTQYPQVEIVVSTTTQTGMQVARRHFGDAQVFYCPLDFSWSVTKALDRIKPTMLVLAELELWPNLISHARRRNIPVGVINARLSDSSYRGYRRARLLLKPMLRSLSFVAAQDPTTAQRFASLGVPHSRVHVTGSIKFDGAPTDRSHRDVVKLRTLAGVRSDHQVWLAGSTIDPEESLTLEIYQQLSPIYPQLRFMLVPRHPERFDAVAKQVEQAGLVCRRRSQLFSSVSQWNANEVLLIDTIGELKNWWGTADIAFVGGSMGNRGGQNMLEPAGYGAAVCFGPDTRNFKDIAARLLEANAAVRVQDAQELAAFVSRSLDDPDEARTRGELAHRLVLDGRGATARTIQIVGGILQQPLERTAA